MWPWPDAGMPLALDGQHSFHLLLNLASTCSRRRGGGDMAATHWVRSSSNSTWITSVNEEVQPVRAGRDRVPVEHDGNQGAENFPVPLLYGLGPGWEAVMCGRV
jgi:hypothetical protein